MCVASPPPSLPLAGGLAAQGPKGQGEHRESRAQHCAAVTGRDSDGKLSSLTSFKSEIGIGAVGREGEKKKKEAQQPGAHTLKPHSFETMSFGEALHVMQMLKLTVQTASFGRAQHWKVGKRMGGEIGRSAYHTGSTGMTQDLLPPPSLPLPGYRSPTDHRIDLLHRRWRGMRVAK